MADLLTKAGLDWLNTKVGFSLTNKNNVTEVHFYHTVRKQDNEHFSISNFAGQCIYEF